MNFNATCPEPENPQRGGRGRVVFTQITLRNQEITLYSYSFTLLSTILCSLSSRMESSASCQRRWYACFSMFVFLSGNPYKTSKLQSTLMLSWLCLYVIKKHMGWYLPCLCSRDILKTNEVRCGKCVKVVPCHSIAAYYYVTTLSLLTTVWLGDWAALLISEEFWNTLGEKSYCQSPSNQRRM